LREELRLVGAEKGCDHGQCGACTVAMDGQRVLACLTLAAQAQGRAVTTIEGLAHLGGPPRGDALHPMQQAFIDNDAFQCGYCTPGQIMSAVACVAEGRTSAATCCSAHAAASSATPGARVKPKSCSPARCWTKPAPPPPRLLLSPVPARRSTTQFVFRWASRPWCARRWRNAVPGSMRDGDWLIGWGCATANDNFAEYLIPVNADIGQVDVILVPEVDSEVDPSGAKGIGELANVGTAAAVANAVFHASGKRIRALPITIDKLIGARAKRCGPERARPAIATRLPSGAALPVVAALCAP